MGGIEPKTLKQVRAYMKELAKEYKKNEQENREIYRELYELAKRWKTSFCLE